LIRIHETPSTRRRDQIIETLQAWFGEIDFFEARKRLSRGGAILISGLDEDSAKRVSAALEKIKAPASVERKSEGKGLAARLLNWGLGVSALSMIMALISGGFLGFLFFLIAVGAPVGVALRREPGAPLASDVGMALEDLAWVDVARKYQARLGDMDERSKSVLKDFIEQIFALRRALRSDSVASHAAGGVGGSIYENAPKAIEAGIELSVEISHKEMSQREAGEKELLSLSASVRKALESIMELDRDSGAKVRELSEEIDDLSSRAQGILREIRPDQRKKTLDRTT
jgi:hypothetical protein